MRAVVFGYGEVGIRGLATLLAQAVEVPLVVTHADDPGEAQWFSSLAQFAMERDLPVVMPENPADADLLRQVADCQPDFLFSLYYRRMLPQALLEIPARGALNMHGSLLPRFRGRAPINWAVLEGATQTGATLHYMTAKPDAGAIVDQQSVPILPDDTALDVFRKVCCVAELVLHRSLPALVAGTAATLRQDLTQGRYFGARRPADGIIDWSQPAQRIHNLVRAVAPPYPGASTELNGCSARILRTLWTGLQEHAFVSPTLFGREGRIYASCGDGLLLRILEMEIGGAHPDHASLAASLVLDPVTLPLRRHA